MTPEEFEEALASHRALIGDIDGQLVALLNKRFDICQQIGELKKQTGSGVRDKNREESLMMRLENDERYPGMVRCIWDSIFEFSRSLQRH